MPQSHSSSALGASSSDLALAPGHRVLRLDETGSTNAQALGRAALGEPGGLWVVARSQAGGRGRGGRAWASPPGNLYASHLVRPSCPLAVAQQLTLLAPVALFDGVAQLLKASTGSSETIPVMRLKWPNDLLVDGAKVSGILLESAFSPDPGGAPDPAGGGSGLAIVMGFGLNLASHPPSLDQSATHLQAHGCTTNPQDALIALSGALHQWLARWNEGAGFDRVLAAWLQRAGAIGEPLSVRTSPDPAAPRLTGAFAGLDVDGALLLDHADGSQTRHVQGDVALGAEDR